MKIITLCTSDDLSQNIALPTAVAPHACPPPSALLPHLTVKEQLQLTAVAHQQPFPTDLLDLVAFDANSRISQLPHSQRHTLCLLNGFARNADSLLFTSLGDGLSQSARQQLWTQLRQLQRPCTIYLLTNNPDTITAVADEVWQIENGAIAHQWTRDNFPAYLTRSAHYALTFTSPQKAQQFQQKISPSADTFGLINHAIVPDDPAILQVTLRDKNNLVSLISAANHNLKTFRTIPATSHQTPATSHQSLATCHSLPVALTLAKTEWRRHFRSFWKGLNVLLSNILVLGMALAALQSYGQLPERSWLLLLGIALLMSAGMGIGWGVESLFQWQRPYSLAEYVPVSALTLGGGLVGGQALILLTHAAVFLSIWAVAWTEAIPFALICYAFWGLMGINALMLIPLLAKMPRTTNQAWVVGWLSFAVIIFTGAGLNRLPLEWWPIAWLWPFTADLYALSRGLTADSLYHLIIPLILSLALSGFWAWLGIRTIKSYERTT